MKLVSKNKLKDLININIICANLEIYDLFLESITVQKFFYINNNSLTPIDIFYDDIISIRSWTQEEHNLFELSFPCTKKWILF